jgi:acetyl-CoA synthetase
LKRFDLMNIAPPQKEKLRPATPFAWTPSPDYISTTNIGWLMRHLGVDTYEAAHAWSVQNREEFWKLVIERLGIRFQRSFSRVMDLYEGIENPQWLPDAQLNIVESCFTAPADSAAVVYQTEGGELKTKTVAELAGLTGRVASNLKRRGFKPNDALAIIMPMTAEAVAIYLGIIKAGCVAVGIADSFSPKEIAARLRLSRSVAVFTQDVITRNGKILPLYAKVSAADAPMTIVLRATEKEHQYLRPKDCSWIEFLKDNDSCAAATRNPSDPINILFSSGTTGEPKAVPWTQTTPIKCAMDAHFHQNIQPGDVLVWPTNLGWMMGPWLIFASLLNQSVLGLYYGAPTGREFGRFVQESGATMLGVVPSMVKTWRDTACMEHLDWNSIKILSSTGECSNADDMRWLMSRAGCKPVIEYCGGTEIGGGYITGTVTRPCQPGTFNAPALGLDFVILDTHGIPAKTGELFLVPPSIGLSTTLLNQPHHEIYFADLPENSKPLRRHGDLMEELPGGFWRALGRADDTMNLGGIKVSPAEIEQVLQSVPQVKETAAVAVSSNGGPSQLVIYAVCFDDQLLNKEALMISMQNAIKRQLNPLFKIYDLILVDALSRTASNKVSRRELRDGWGSVRADKNKALM